LHFCLFSRIKKHKAQSVPKRVKHIHIERGCIFEQNKSIVFRFRKFGFVAIAD